MRFLLPLILLTFSSLATAQEGRTKTRLLFGFEQGNEIVQLSKGSENVDLILVQDNGVTEGKNCARLTAKRGSDYAHLKLPAEATRNWSDFDYLALDLFTEDEHPYVLNFELWDANSKNYPTRFTNSEIKTRPGRQTLLYPINRAKRNGKEGRTWEELEPQDKIKMINVFMACQLI